MAKALRKAGYSESVAKGQPSDVVGPIREIALAEMERQGVTPAAVIERLRTRLYSLTLKNIKHNGVDHTIDVEDNQSQLRAIELAGNIHGLWAPKETRTQHSGSLDIHVKREEQTSVWERLGGIS
jgi:hypothetical protein